MEQYNLLICDDEWMIREQVKRSALEVGGFTVFLADSGLTALEILAENSIDGVILDVRMPEMDGISLLKELRQQEKDPVVIILSGHDEFDYAQQCLHYGAADYLLKPVTDAQIKTFLAELRERISRKHLYNSKVQEYGQKLDAIKPILRKQFFSQLLQKSLSQESVQRMEQFLDVHILAPYLVVAVVNLKFSGNHLTDEQDSLQHYVVGELLENQLQEKVNANLFYTDNEVMTVIAGGVSEQIHVELSAALGKALEELAKDLSMQFYIGIGSVVSSVEKVRDSYAQALYALSSSDFEQEKGILNIQDVLNGVNREDNTREIRSALREVTTSAAVTNNQDLVEKLRSILKTVRETEQDLDTGIYYCSYLAILALDSLDIQLELLRRNPVHEITSKTTLEEVYRSTENLLDEMSRMLTTNKQKRIRHLADTCRKIIERDYDKKIGVVEIADQMGVSCNYLSTIFKKETQYSISEYLNAVRLKHAKRMLQDTNLKVYEIAELVGFSDTYYFSSVFKKQTGVSPSDYRNSLY